MCLNAKFAHNVTLNVDTSLYRFNWLGQSKKMNSRGEQSLQRNEATNNLASAVAQSVFRLSPANSLSVAHTFSRLARSNRSKLEGYDDADPSDKLSVKNISGLSFSHSVPEVWNAVAFVKHYLISASGPASASGVDRLSALSRHWGYGLASTVFFASCLQAKLSYENACRLPSAEELFGDDDLESGSVSIRPETSHNVNFSLSFSRTLNKHAFFCEAGLVFRNTDDCIKRNLNGIIGASYLNYGKVATRGFNVSLRYDFNKRLSLGANFTDMSIRDRQKTILGSSGVNVSYGQMMPNVPYIFADADLSYRWRNVFRRGCTLSLSYANYYLHDFCYNAANVGVSNKSDYMVPMQFSHDASLAFSARNGRYNLTLQAKNFTDEDLYDNFSLQKAGRAFYAKFRLYLHKLNK